MRLGCRLRRCDTRDVRRSFNCTQLLVLRLQTRDVYPEPLYAHIVALQLLQTRVKMGRWRGRTSRTHFGGRRVYSRMAEPRPPLHGQAFGVVHLVEKVAVLAGVLDHPTGFAQAGIYNRHWNEQLDARYRIQTDHRMGWDTRRSYFLRRRSAGVYAPTKKNGPHEPCRSRPTKPVYNTTLL